LTLTLLFGLRLGAAARRKFLLFACLRLPLVFLPAQLSALLITAFLSFAYLLSLDRAAPILGGCDGQHCNGQQKKPMHFTDPYRLQFNAEQAWRIRRCVLNQCGEHSRVRPVLR
jgi:hypothetical protein